MILYHGSNLIVEKSDILHSEGLSLIYDIN